MSLRLFNVYGPRSRTKGVYGAVFGVFLAQKLRGHPFTVVGDGTQTRDFLYVTDAASAFLLAAESQCSQEIFNVGAGRPQSINRLAELLGGDVVGVPTRPGEPDCTCADIRKIEERLGWVAQVSLDDGVATMLRHLDDWADAPVCPPAAIDAATKAWFTYVGQRESQPG